MACHSIDPSIAVARHLRLHYADAEPNLRTVEYPVRCESYGERHFAWVHTRLDELAVEAGVPRRTWLGRV